MATHTKMDLWRCCVGRADLFTRDGKSAAVFADELSVAVDSGICIKNSFGSKHKLEAPECHLETPVRNLVAEDRFTYNNVA